MEKLQFCAPCLFGIEGILGDELRRMGAQEVRPENGRVLFSGDMAMLARANIQSRYAERIQIWMGSFPARTFDELFEGVRALPWERFIGGRNAFPVKGWSLNSALHSVPDCQSIVKKAVVERLKGVYGIQWFEETGCKVQIQFTLLRDEATLLLDTSGPGLHKRGYRPQAGGAPIKETLAAAIADLTKARFAEQVIDPCCGSGGMFVQSMKFVEAHHGNKKQVSIYGQEYTNTTYKLCKMNLAIRGISANLGETAANTFTNDQHKDLKADYIMANPPFNQKAWRAENELIDDPRWDGYEVPPTSNANYGWILNIVSKLSQNGVAGFLLANGALSDDGTELKIRKQLIENNLVEAIIILPRNLFYTTDISVTLWILNKNKKARVIEQNGQLKRYRNREREILFMDLRQMGSPYEKKYIELTEEDRAKITSVYHNWQQEGYEETYENIPEFCYSASFEEVAEKGFTLVPSRYIEFVNRDENIDFDTKMKTLQAELKELLVQEEKSKADLLAVFKELGYEIEL